MAHRSGLNWLFFPDPNWLCTPGANTSTQKRTEAKEAFESYRELILENIDYDILAGDPHVDREQLDEIVDLMQETVCSTRDRIRVGG